jgi:PAS domain S-box-containing protein
MAEKEMDRPHRRVEHPASDVHLPAGEQADGGQNTTASDEARAPAPYPPEERESEAIYRSLFEDNHAVMLLIDPESGAIIDANPAASAYYGWSRAELKRRRIDEINTLTRAEIHDQMQLARTEKRRNFFFKHRRAGGEIRDVEVYSGPLTLKGRTLLYSIVHDITERKIAEEERAKLEDQNRQLQKAESLGRMAGAIAHRFNNLLGVVLGNLEMALEGLARGARPVENLAEAMQAARRAAEVSGLMLTYLGQTRTSADALDLSETCRRSLQMLRAAVPEEVILMDDLPPRGPVIQANANHIQQVLTNLCTNAWEAIGGSRGTIQLSLKVVSPGEIPAAHRFPLDWQPQEAAYACLSIEDSGCGIAGKDVEKIFDPFFSSKFAGRGLGLPVVLGVVKAYGGAVTVESRPGKGSIFSLYFPVSAEEAALQPDPSAEALPVEAGGTVLLVEDDDMLRKLTDTALRSLGFDVLAAGDGAEALDVFRRHQGDIRFVLCDLTMPRMDGWETIAALRRLSPGVPVILTSGFNEAQVMAGDHPTLPDVFLCKPYERRELIAAIGQIVSIKR